MESNLVDNKLYVYKKVRKESCRYVHYMSIKELFHIIKICSTLILFTSVKLRDRENSRKERGVRIKRNSSSLRCT